MSRKDLINKVINRKRLLNLTIEQIANLTGLGIEQLRDFLVEMM
jgi:predicted transposase YdaD